MNVKILSAIVLVPLAVAGCTKSSMSPDSEKEAKEYIVTLACGGEIKDVTVSDLTKAEGENNDLYGVQVYSRPAQSEDAYTPYAYGLFDSMEGREIKLLEGYDYKFVATMVKDGKEMLNKSSDDCYYLPFFLHPVDKSTKIASLFVYDAVNYFSGLSSGSTYLGKNKGDAIFDCPNTDRYYGETDGYIPSESGKVSISMKRIVFGLKVKAEKLTEGSLSIAMKDAPSMTITSPDTEIQDIFTFYNVKDAWATDNYKESIEVSFAWTKADGVVVPIATQTFDFYRNKLTTITVEVSDKSEDNGVGVEMEDGSMTEGGSYNVGAE